MLATALLLFLVAATVIGASPWVVGLAAAGAALTKETGYPYVSAIGLIGLYLLRDRTGIRVRSRLVWGGLGLVIGAACNAGLNLIRYGVVTNTEYLEAKYRAVPLHVELDSFAGLFASPSGGLIFFWPSVVVLIGVLLACSLRRRRETLVLAAIVLALTLVQVGLATWWAPFGWFAWGPRLTLPWVWPFLLLAIVAAASNVGPPLGRVLASPVRLAATAGALLLTSLPTVGYLWKPDVVARFFGATTVACPRGIAPGGRQYYSGLHERMWSRHPLLLDALHGLASAPAVLTVIAVAVVVTGSLIVVRREQLAAVPNGAVNQATEPALADR
jgi:biotin transporter BioY